MKNYEQTCTRLGCTLFNACAWYEGEKMLGIIDSLFICENGKMKQFVEDKDATNFNNYVESLTEEEFNNICDEFYKAVMEKDLVTMHKGLAVFDEMDNFNFGTDNMKRRLMRIRKATESISYDFKGDEGCNNFILYKGRVFLESDRDY